MTTRRRRDEDGAAALLVAAMSVVLLVCAGMAVDLGNGWARGRSAQTQADVVALASAHLLPMDVTKVGHRPADIRAEVLRRLQANRITGQEEALEPADVGVEFYASRATAKTGLTQCLTLCPVMKVTTPVARVHFGLGAVTGQDGLDVRRSAIVAVESELVRRQDMLPFWLPSGCGYGPVQADTTQGGNGSAASTPTPSPSPTPTPTPSPSAVPSPTTVATPLATAPRPTPIGLHLLVGTNHQVPAGTTRSLGGYSVTSVPSAYKKVTLRAISPDGTRFVDFAAEGSGSGALPTITVGPGDVTGTIGTWFVFALATKSNGRDTEFSVGFTTITVTSVAATPTPSVALPTTLTTATSVPVPTLPTATATPTPTGDPAGCVGQDRGNFGQLDTPRADESNAQKAFARNIALGLDHRLERYTFRPSDLVVKSCGLGISLIFDAALDDVGGVGGDGANCIKGETGNDGPKTYDGLVAGLGAGVHGRLDVRNGPTTCPGRQDVVVDGVTLNNDTLACFLRNGATKASIAAEVGADATMLDASIVDSPRFVYLPVVYASDRAQKTFQPIRSFVPGFITSETTTAGPDDTLVNGLEINGNSVKVLRVFVFNRAALPPSETSESAEYDAELGRGVVRLVG